LDYTCGLVQGTVVGSYCILDAISAGGMGTVYRAQHTLLGRLAAVKILHPELCSNRDIVNRFFNEAKTTTSIKHPGIVEVFDFGYMDTGHAYLIMELLEGQALSRRIRERGQLPEGEAAAILRGVCVALSAAHDKGIIHRDLKPDNIFVTSDPDSQLGARTKILDFGIAKLTEIGLAGSATKTGAVMGTPTYMSPEQCRGTGEIDFRADLYSIGCVLYEMVTGRAPFVHTGAGELIGAHLFVEPDRPSRHVEGLSPDTESLIMRLLAKSPELRVQTAQELGQILSEIAVAQGWIAAGDHGHPSPSHPVGTPPASLRGPAIGSLSPSAVRMLDSLPTPTDARPTPEPLIFTDNLTTLSGAASQLEMRAFSRKRLGIVVGCGLAFTTAGVVAFLAVSGARAHTRRASAAAQQQQLVAPAMPPTPPMPSTRATPGAPLVVPATRHAVVSPPPPVPAETPTPTAVPVVLPGNVAARLPTTTAPKPTRHPPTSAPTTKPPAAAPKKPEAKPDELLEQDI
jgi:eukaryotic-like serine/threonine-protein kinase